MTRNTRQRAVVVDETGWVVLGEADVPKLVPGKILVKVVTAAQNPADWKTVTLGKKTGATVGCDFAGIVEEIGPDVPEGVRTVGERVAGFVLSATGNNGSFSEYVVAPAQAVVHIPSTWSFEDAAQLGIAPFTAAQTLFLTLRLPTPLAPAPSPIPLLISGGSSSVGLYAIQLARLSGLRVLATASPKNFDLVKSYGVDEVYDYHDPEAGKKINRSTGGHLKEALDCIAERGTQALISDALSDDGGIVAIINSCESPRAGVKVIFSTIATFLGEPIELPFPATPTADDIEQGKKYRKDVVRASGLWENQAESSFDPPEWTCERTRRVEARERWKGQCAENNVSDFRYTRQDESRKAATMNLLSSESYVGPGSFSFQHRM
ncbi:hypothetical protein EW146_g5246 [Bondarzewia mesenterica]|uniref:Enoyl reductase (ER) domain-containing protein n=1 Tax=Bondarzewia mesenterica TaxID=1095465 RepID=A0A4S4LS36_9AGAM|nr:hypothetical protein EW146_g5246 [Bondarzewia mesenterica]